MDERNIVYKVSFKSWYNLHTRSLVTWSIFKGCLDQKQIFNFVRPKHDFKAALNIVIINIILACCGCLYNSLALW